MNFLLPCFEIKKHFFSRGSDFVVLLFVKHFLVVWTRVNWRISAETKLNLTRFCSGTGRNGDSSGKYSGPSEAMLVVFGPRSLPPTDSLMNRSVPLLLLLLQLCSVSWQVSHWCSLCFVSYFMFIWWLRCRHASLCVVKFKGVSVTLRTLLRSLLFVYDVRLYFDWRFEGVTCSLGSSSGLDSWLRLRWMMVPMCAGRVVFGSK